MAETDTQSIEEIVTRPGVYFNPQTEVLIVVDDSSELDGEIFNMEEFEGSDWVAVSNEVPIDEPRRDELLEDFQVHYHAGGASSISGSPDDNFDGNGDDENGENDDQEVGRED